MAAVYRVTKRYGHSEGWSCAFRQWRATDSHCRFIHGYALAFEFTFECGTLDARNWVIDFGGFKGLKQSLQLSFDHVLAIAADDPQKNEFMLLQSLGLADVRVMEDVGCEKFAEAAFWMASVILSKSDRASDVRIVEARCSEHEGNSASYCVM